MKITTKRIIALILTIVLSMSFSGCSMGDNEKVNEIVSEVKQTVEETIKSATETTLDQIDKIDVDDATSTNENTEIDKDVDGDADISITMLDVGQGLSILIESDNEYMLYDGGDRGTSSYVVSYLEQHDVDHLDYMIASHYDSDHLAGLVGVLETTSVDTVINPDFEATTKIYNSYVSKRDSSGAKVVYPSVGDVYELGDATFTILAPAKNYGDANEISVAIKIECEDFSCVITGDAETESEADMVKSGLDLDCDLYIVGHHGSSSSSADAFVKAMSPEYAFISVGADNDYGHPTDKTLNTLNKYNAIVYRSDMHGEVNCYYDGNIHITTEMDAQESGEEVDDENASWFEDDSIEYTLNTNSMKFHYSDCESVEKMSEKNKEYSDKDRDVLIEEGYSPCGLCNP